ncbi:MAG TPA: metalloregulator ArsR/SmtB family transcription factor [Fibrobacteria bacterium]|nr:metalloregulator ArsR/SmtB family transcription factor [Fibrobacteria bacterium]
MAISKKTEFTNKEQHIATVAKALSHPARIAILKALAMRGTCICGEIVEVLPLAQSTVSQHLKELKEAGLVTGEVEGTRSCYCIDWDVLGKAWALLRSLVEELETSRKKCC